MECIGPCRLHPSALGGACATWSTELRSSWADGAARAGQAAQQSVSTLGSPDIGVAKCWRGCRWKRGLGAPLPGMPNVEFWVLQNLDRFELWGACGDLNLPSLPTPRSHGLACRTQRTRGHKISTGSGHRCGVIPYSSVVWWIAL